MLCSSLLLGLLVHKMTPDGAPWTFVVDVPQTPVRGPLELATEVLTAPHEDYFVHGASVIGTPTGLLAFWYRAKYEGAADGELISSAYDGSRWSPTTVVTNSSTVSRDIGLDDQIRRQPRAVPALPQRNLAILLRIASLRLGDVRDIADAQPRQRIELGAC